MTGSAPPAAAGRIRVLLVDDHLLVTRALRMLLEAEDGFEVVGEARDRAAALDLCGRHRPHVVLLDLDLGRESGLDLIGHLGASLAGTRVLVLTGLRDSEAHRRALRLGARGVVEKESAAERLVKAIRAVHAGEIWSEGIDLSAAPGAAPGTAPASAPFGSTEPEAVRIARLSLREREVLTLIAEGLSNRRIGERLAISETTVRHHLTSIFAKLDVHDRLELLLYAYRRKLVPPPSA